MRDALEARDQVHRNELASLKASLTNQGDASRAAALEAAAQELKRAQEQWEADMRAAQARHAQVGCVLAQSGGPGCRGLRHLWQHGYRGVVTSHTCCGHFHV